MALKEEMIMRVDFNAVDRDGRLPALLRYAMGSGRLAIGDWVWLMDGDGNGCLGRVVEVNGDLVEVEPNWATWNPPIHIDEPQSVSYSGWSLQYPGEEAPSVKASGHGRPYIQV